MTGGSEGFFQVRKFWQVFLRGILFRTEKNGKNRGEKKKRLLPYLVFRDTCSNTRGHVVIVILSLLGICKAPKFSMGFLEVSFTYWFRRFFGLSLQARSIFFCGFRLCRNSHLPVT